MDPQSVFKPSTCDFGLTGENPSCLLCLPFSDSCGSLVTLHDREMSGLEMGSVTKEAIFSGTFSPPHKCRKSGPLLNNIMFVFTPSWDRDCVTSYSTYCFRAISQLLSDHTQKNGRHVGILVQISVLIYVATYSRRGRDSSVGIATGYGLDGPGIESW
jgi:hypothetical protein